MFVMTMTQEEEERIRGAGGTVNEDEQEEMAEIQKLASAVDSAPETSEEIPSE
ncbi:hypothetical protein [Xanthomonas phage JGB6]|nr:hypothetical protein [Xanthomonas phage JGB6]